MRVVNQCLVILYRKNMLHILFRVLHIYTHAYRRMEPVKQFKPSTGDPLWKTAPSRRRVLITAAWERSSLCWEHQLSATQGGGN